jgi:hypothetical protein
MPFEFLQHAVLTNKGDKTLKNHDAKPAAERAYVYSDFLSGKHNRSGSSHNLYTVYSDDNHKILAPHQSSSDPWNDERIKATLWAERKQEIIESILEALIFAGFGAMIVLAYLT